MKLIVAVLAACLVAVACSSEQATSTGTHSPSEEPVARRSFPPAPPVPEGPLAPDVAAAVERLHEVLATIELGPEIDVVASSADPRIGWYLSDLLRFESFEGSIKAILEMFNGVAGTTFVFDPAGTSNWVELTNLLIAWDIPSFEGYVDLKQGVFERVDGRWKPFFEDDGATVDWRHVTWGGVFADSRPLGSSRECMISCIPALDDPELTSAADGDWYDDDRIVFGVVVDGDAVAFPKHQMETHELVNITIGGTRLGIPYCTLCGSAQAWVTEGITEEPLVLRTSGLLNRSNKMMFDLGTQSLIDTFTGEATSGPLRRQGVQLEQVSVVTSTWGAWKAEHPNTRIVAEDGGIGREYEDDPLGSRDDNGPIFPVGEVDSRLPAQQLVVGVVTEAGDAVAFSVSDLRTALDEADGVTFAGVTVRSQAGGFVAEEAGASTPTHEAFWFAWSQFHPDTMLWRP